MAQDHEHSHHEKRRILHASKTCRLATVLSLTILYFFVEVLSSYWLDSVAIFADAIHMLNDSGALIIAMVSLRISKRKSSKNTFGWIRAQELGAMVNAILLISLSFPVLVKAIKRLISIERMPEEKLKSYILVGIVGLIINLLGLLILRGDLAHGHSHGGGSHGHSHGSKSKNSKKKDEDEIESGAAQHLCDEDGLENRSDDHHGHSHSPTSDAGNISGMNGDSSTQQVTVVQPKKKKMDGGQMNIRGAFLHVLGDAIGSVIVVVAGLAMRTWPDKDWVQYIDPAASLVMICMIISFAVPLLRDSALVLLQTVPIHIEVAELQKRLINEVPGVLDVHEFHVWQLSGTKIIASAHIRCQNLNQYMEIAEKVKEFFHKEGIHSTTIQPEFVDTTSLQTSLNNKDCILQCLNDCSVNTCCGQPSTNIKQRTGRNETVQGNLPSVNEITVPQIEITAPSRSNSYVE